MTVRVGIYHVLHSILNKQDFAFIMHHPLQGYFAVRPNVQRSTREEQTATVLLDLMRLSL